MANIKASKKDIRRIAKRTERNRAAKSRLKTLRLKALKARESGDTEAAKTAAVELISAVDKAAKGNVIHRNKADRLKSQFSKTLMGATPTSE